ncbi:MAG TPA: MFS transporter [Candidatus Paceibacterota bacterium]|nr:MFS transporter [Candidatus Paceibacterota bacterium]
MLSPYRSLFKTPGGLRFSLAGFIGRMPISMDPLAIIFVVVHVTHSYTLAGSLAAVAAVVVTFALPFWSRTADRIGQGKTLLIAVPLRTLSILVFILLVAQNAPRWTWFLSIIFAEAFFVNTGGLVRRRWLWTLGEDRTLINTAFSFEALMDEIVFIFGPVLATACAASIDPAAGLFVGLVFLLLGSLAFALQRSTEPPAHPRDHEDPHPPVLRNTALQAVVLTTLFLGGFFSSVSIVVVGYMQSQNATSRTGLMLAVWSLGSGASAIVNGSIKWQMNHAKRFWIFLFALTILSTPFLFVHGLAALAIALFLNGIAVAPLLVSAYGLAESAVPPEQTTESLAWVIAGMPLGGAVSSAIAGWVIDNYGAQRGFILPLAFLCGAMLMSLPYFRTWNRLRSAS